MLAPAQTFFTERRPLAALDDIVAPWRELAGRAAESNVFYDPAFALAAAPVFGRGVEVVLVWSAGSPRRLLGLFPFEVATHRYGAKLPLLIGWTHRFAPLGTPLVDREACAQAVAALIDHVAGDDSLPKFLLLPLLNETGPVAAAIAAAIAQGSGMCARFGRHQRAMLKPADDRVNYIERAIGRKRRKELGRQRRRIADAGTVNFELATTPAAVAAALPDFFALERGGWKGNAGTAIAQHSDIRRFVETAIMDLAARGQARVARLTCRSRPIACAVMLTSADATWGWKIAYDEDFARGSPGVQIYLDLTDALLADPAFGFADSCATSDHPMIDHLWRERLDIGDWLIAPRQGATFALVRRLEAARRHVVATLRKLRDRIHRGP
jgi:CelD/BcsL family acetyltransferase involved in cellulose biosynthesis